MMPRVFIFSCFLLALFSVAHAATDTFTIGATVSDDVTAPSTPTSLSATPVSTSQIDLSWSSSTDNVAVTGYQVFRDSAFLATTTSASYSDTGLTEDTLYTYFVRAFDSVFNTSSSSASVATTTLVTPPTPTPTSTPTTGGVSGGILLPRLVYLEVIPGTTGALIVWRTENPARTTLRYGRTSSYELGASIGQFFKKEHQTVLADLDPATTYRFMIEGENPFGMEKVLTVSSFRTLDPVDIFPPANVKDLTAVREGNDVVLAWDNPTEADFSRVRLLGNDRFYPGDIADGAFIYEGRDEHARDVGMAIPGTVRFYTIFSYDELGNISSGAVIAIRIDADGNVHMYDVDEIPLASPEYLISLSLEDFIFEQEGVFLATLNGDVHIDGSKQFKVSLPYKVLPEHLKSIVMTLKNTSGESFSFLLRVNDDHTLYTASIAPLGMSGEFPFTASVFDYSVRKVAELQGAVISEVVTVPALNLWELLKPFGYIPYFVLLLMALVCGGLLLIKKSRNGREISSPPAQPK